MFLACYLYYSLLRYLLEFLKLKWISGKHSKFVLSRSPGILLTILVNSFFMALLMSFSTSKIPPGIYSKVLKLPSISTLVVRHQTRKLLCLLAHISIVQIISNNLCTSSVPLCLWGFCSLFFASEEAVLGKTPWLLHKEYDYYLGRLSTLSLSQALGKVNPLPR